MAAVPAIPASPAAAAAGATPADSVYRNGYVYTVDAQDSVQTAVAIRDGRIVYVGNDAGLAPFTGEKTQVVDLQGKCSCPVWSTGICTPCRAGQRCSSAV
jgi:adenine deaminase